MRSLRDNTSGFTIVELLTVVSLIGILAVLAAMSFMTAETKARLSRTYSDMGTLAGAINACYLENTTLPRAYQFSVLTTPVAYISTYPVVDAFREGRSPPGGRWVPVDNRNYVFMPAESEGLWWLSSDGPDCDYDKRGVGPQETGGFLIYDPDNGLTSDGNIYRFSDGFNAVTYARRVPP